MTENTRTKPTPDSGTDAVEVTQAVHSQGFINTFWAKVDKTPGHGPDGECWPWTASRSSTGAGYGRVYVDGIGRPATQVAWEIDNGQPFPRGMLACHSCDNSPCVRPSHIWPGTQSDNIKDCANKGRHPSKPQAFCKRGHKMTPHNRRPTTGGFRCGECSRQATKERMRKMRARRREAPNG